MSRAYRIRLRTQARKVLKGSDQISTQFEILRVLSCQEMARLLSENLKRKGFEEKQGKLTLQEGVVSITIDPETGDVNLTASSEKSVDIQVDRDKLITDRSTTQQITRQLERVANEALAQKGELLQNLLQKDVSSALEAKLSEVLKTLDQVINEVTIEALKIRAAQLGRVKEISEDTQSGNVTILVEL